MRHPSAAGPRRAAWPQFARRAGWVAVAAALMLDAAPPAHGCVWDCDFAAARRFRRNAEVDVLSGRFPRRSLEAYRWRIEERLRRSAAEPENLALLDDLAVAYQKCGRHDLAVQTILRRRDLRPTAYEPYANLGGFYFAERNFELCVEALDQALALEPNADYGRESVQRRLAQYAIQRRVDGRLVLPLGAPRPGTEGDSFARHAGDAVPAENWVTARRGAAIEGVLGMLRFADFKDPLLLEAAGDLYADDADQGPSLRNYGGRAAQCYLAASYQVEDPAARAYYRERAAACAAKIRQIYGGDRLDARFTSLNHIEERFLEDRREADARSAEMRRDEVRWIGDGVYVDAAFFQKYVVEPRWVIDPLENTASNRLKNDLANRGIQKFIAVCAVVGAILVAGLAYLIHRLLPPPGRWIDPRR